MYSQAKQRLLEERLLEEQAHPVTDESIKQIREALNPEQLTILSQTIEKLQPIIDARNKEALAKAQLDNNLSSLAYELSQLTKAFNDVKDELKALENLKSANAEQEKAVLNRLMEVL